MKALMVFMRSQLPSVARDPFSVSVLQGGMICHYTYRAFCSGCASTIRCPRPSRLSCGAICTSLPTRRGGERSLLRFHKLLEASPYGLLLTLSHTGDQWAQQPHNATRLQRPRPSHAGPLRNGVEGQGALDFHRGHASMT